MRGDRSHSTRRRGPELVWDADRSDPRYAPPRSLALATAALPAGFAVAEATGVRPLGGAVLGALAIAALLTSRSSRPRQGLYLAVLASLFVLLHTLADPLGTIPAIAVVTVAAGAAAFRILRPAQPAAPSS